MRRWLIIVAGMAITCVLCSDIATAASPAGESSPPVSLGSSLAPFAPAAIISVLLLALLGLTTGAGSALSDVPDSWSLDSWVTTVTGGSSALLALFGATDALTALLGHEDKQADAKLVIVSGLSALLVALAPLVSTVVGTLVGSDKVGMLFAAGVTLTGAIGLVTGVWTVFSDALPEPLAYASLAGAIVLIVVGLLLAYAFITLRSLLNGDATTQITTSTAAGGSATRKRSSIL